MLGNRYSKKTRPKDEGEKPFWISFADLMTALMTLFLVVMAVSLMIVTKKINEATQAEDQRSAEILNICQSIKHSVKLKDAGIEVDCKNNRINFGEAGRFSHNDYRLNEVGRNRLNTIVPIILEEANNPQGEKWFNLEKVKGFPLFQDEILMVPLLGHSAGHCGIAIKQQNQWLLFCGDAYYSHLELNPANKLRSLSLLEKTFAEDNEKRLINLKKLQHLAQHEPTIEIICAHDPHELRRYQT